MKFLRINIKVLLILCLFSGILLLSSGCGENNNNNNDDNEVKQPTNNKTDSNVNSQTNEKETETNVNNNVSLNNTTDYSVWVANTTINTDKGQRSYKVIWGDTLWLISTAWEVPYKQIAAYNNIPNPDLIYVDQIIYNPTYK